MVSAVLLFALGIQPAHSQSGQQPANPIWMLPPLPQPTKIQPDRLSALETLADVWSKVVLFHPRAATDPYFWDSALARAIPAVERATTPTLLVAALNEHVLQPLGDPLSYASLPAPTIPQAVEGVHSRVLAPGAGYLSIRDPRILQEATAIEVIADAIMSLGKVDGLVVDARWIPAAPPEFAAEWLRLWVDSSIVTGRRVFRQHEGWSHTAPVACCAGVTGERWLAEQQFTLERFTSRSVISRFYRLPESMAPVTIPTTFLVNRTALPYLQRELDALSATGRVRVALDLSGPPSSGSFVSTYSDRVQVRVNAGMLLGVSGSLGVRVDTVRGETTDSALLTMLRYSPRSTLQLPPFAWPPRYGIRAAAAKATLTREERIEAIIKLWTVLGHLYAFRATYAGDWDQFLAENIPRAEAAEDLTTFAFTLRNIAARFRDSHATVSFQGSAPPDTARRWTIPARLEWVGDRVLVAMLANDVPVSENSLKLGDEILSIDGMRISAIEAAHGGFISASHPGVLRYLLSNGTVLGTRDVRNSKARVELRRLGKRMALDVPRSSRGQWMREITLRHPVAQRLPGNLAYINLGRISSEAEIDSLFAEFASTAGVVLDNRYGAGIGEPYGVLRHLGYDDEARWATPVADMIDGTVRRGSLAQHTRKMPNASNVYPGAIVVLTAATQSAAEVLPTWIKATGRGRTVGAATAGIPANTGMVPLPGGGRFVFTALAPLDTHGRSYAGVGIPPDVAVSASLTGIMENRDEVYEKGVEVLRGLVSGSRTSRR